MDKNLPQFKEIIVVRLENRSFDNMCRWLTLAWYSRVAIC